METNLFVFVTRGGSFYDRTNGKNKRLFPSDTVTMETGIVSFGKTNGKLYVFRYNESGKELYRKDITEPGMYIVSALFAQPLVKSPKEVRNLYNRLKTSLGKPNFKIEVNEKLRQPFKIKMHTWLDKGFHYRFIISTKDENVPLSMVEEIYELVNRSSKLDLKMLLKYYGAFNDTGTYFTINEEFFETVKVISNAYRETATALN
jgi:hypothetical protein